MMSLNLCLTFVFLSLLRGKFIEECTEKVEISINLSSDRMEEHKMKLTNSAAFIWVKAL